MMDQAITSARSSDTDMTISSTVLQGGGRTCQCSVMTNRASCRDSYMMTLGNWNGPGHRPTMFIQYKQQRGVGLLHHTVVDYPRLLPARKEAKL